MNTDPAIIYEETTMHFVNEKEYYQRKTESMYIVDSVIAVYIAIAEVYVIKWITTLKILRLSRMLRSCWKMHCAASETSA